MTGFNAIGFFAVCKDLAQFFAGSTDRVAVADSCLLKFDCVSGAVITVIKGDCRLITACRTYRESEHCSEYYCNRKQKCGYSCEFLFLIKFVILKILS